MPEVNVLIAAGLAPPLLKELAGLDGKGAAVTVLDDAQRKLLRPGLGKDESAEAIDLRRRIAESEAIFISLGVPAEILEIAKNVRWIHTQGAGVDDLLEQGFGRGSYIFTNGSGPHAISIAEYIVMQALALLKCLPGYYRQQTEKKWGRIRNDPQHQAFELNGKTVGIVGLGDIGFEAAKRFQALGCHVLATRRSATARQAGAGPVDELLPASDLPDLLQRSDIVALTLALTQETRRIINAETLRLMKPSAFLINIARGGVIDEEALIEALRERRIAGAALDVFEQEPLPPSSPLWDLDNVVITPHTSSASEHFQRRQADLFRENLRRYLAHEPLLNQVDADRGY